MYKKVNRLFLEKENFRIEILTIKNNFLFCSNNI